MPTGYVYEEGTMRDYLTLDFSNCDVTVSRLPILKYEKFGKRVSNSLADILTVPRYEKIFRKYLVK